MRGVKVEAPKAQRGIGFVEGVSPFLTEGGVWGGGCAPSPEKFCIFAPKSHVCDAL